LPSGDIFTSLGTVQPGTVDRSSGVGAVVTFDFLGADALTPGTTSDILVIETNDTNVLPGLTSAQDGSTVTEAAFAPVLGSGTPEPSTIFLFVSGLLAIGMFSHFHKRRGASHI
jgi:hypothetical protein